jgi:hypothetical protein
MAREWREVAVEDIRAPSENALATGPFGSSIGSRFLATSGIPVIRGSNLSQDIGTRLNVDRVHRELTDEDIAKIAGTYHAWRGDKDAELFEEKMKRLTATLREQQAEAATLDAAIAENLKGLGYGG